MKLFLINEYDQINYGVYFRPDLYGPLFYFRDHYRSPTKKHFLKIK